MKLIFLLPVALVLLFYGLYLSGYMVISAKRALVFVGTMGRKGNHCGAKVIGCSGYIKRVFPVKESRKYHFDFQSNITKGLVWVELQDKNKNLVLRLDKTQPDGQLEATRNQRYYLVVGFKGADGSYDLTWK